MTTTFCVTGASGFLGGFVVEELLKLGHTVHGTVRDPADSRNDFLRTMAGRYPEATLKLFAADLNDSASFDAAIAGCRTVLHVAAVVQTHYDKDPMAEVVNPTVNGVLNVVAACKRAGVQRIVYTSSVSTIVSAEAARAPEHRGTPFTEDVWVKHVTPTYGTYNFAKVTAERALQEAWSGECVSILPGWCLGPQQNPRVTSSQQVLQLLARRERPLLPPFSFHWVDVRDVARAHVHAAVNAVPNGRYNAVLDTVLMFDELGASMNRADRSVNAPTRMMPWPLLWVASWFDKRISSFMLYEKATRQAPISNAKLRATGFEFKHTDLDATMADALDTFRQFGLM